MIKKDKYNDQKEWFKKMVEELSTANLHACVIVATINEHDDDQSLIFGAGGCIICNIEGVIAYLKDVSENSDKLFVTETKENVH